jgi:hypothetical protein
MTQAALAPTTTTRPAAPVDADSRRAVLHALLDDGLALSPEYGGGMANHLPMALEALDWLGASEAQMRAFFASYSRRLQRDPTPVELDPAPSTDWRALRGHIDAFGALRAFFAASLAARGRDAVLRDTLPALVDGTAGAFFHGPIRVAHAVESAHDGELAAALAYWTARWIPLPEPARADHRFTDTTAWLDALDARARETDPAWRPAAPLLSERMQQAVRTTAWLELADGLDAGAGDIDALLHDLAKATAARYAATANFAVLHLATASRAAWVLAPWLPSNVAAWAPLLHAVAAASLASRAVPLNREVAATSLAWPDVRRLACASDDDHVIKLVHAMAMQHERSPDAVWLAAARVAVKG